MDGESPIEIDGWFHIQAHPDVRRSIAPYQGQMAPAFQQALAARYGNPAEADCRFEQVVEADGRVLGEGLDLRGHEAAWLGGIDLQGRRVVEYAPRAGWLSAFIAGRAAGIVAFEHAPALPTPVIEISDPATGDANLQAVADVLAMQNRNGWWWLRRALGHGAVAIYGDPEQPPPDLGRFDIAIVGDQLSAAPNPFRVLQGACGIADTVVLVQRIGDEADAAELARPGVALFAPLPMPAGFRHWWHLTPAALAAMLGACGLRPRTPTTHTPPNMPGTRYCTIVADRVRPAETPGQAAAPP